MINNFRIYILIACLFLTNLMVYGQKFEDGYVVLSLGDTLRGRINLGNSTNFSVKFVNPETGTITEYGPQEVTAYGKEGSNLYLAGLIENSFVEVLVQGELSLLLFEDEFYLKQSGDDPVKLTRPDPKNINSGSFRWIGILKSMTSECQEILTLPGSKYKYETDWLLSHIEDYYKCTRKEYELFRNSDNSFQPILSLGMILNGGVAQYNYIFDPTFKDISYSPIFGGSVFIDICNGYSDKKTSYRTGISVNYHELDISSEKSNDVETLQEFYLVRANRLSIEVPFIYNRLLSSKNNFRVQAGLIPYVYIVNQGISLSQSKYTFTTQNAGRIENTPKNDISKDLNLDINLGSHYILDLSKFQIALGLVYRLDLLRTVGIRNNYRHSTFFQIELMYK